jgi:hypothetical protein
VGWIDGVWDGERDSIVRWARSELLGVRFLDCVPRKHDQGWRRKCEDGNARRDSDESREHDVVRG